MCFSDDKFYSRYVLRFLLPLRNLTVGTPIRPWRRDFCLAGEMGKGVAAGNANFINRPKTGGRTSDWMAELEVRAAYDLGIRGAMRFKLR